MSLSRADAPSRTYRLPVRLLLAAFLIRLCAAAEPASPPTPAASLAAAPSQPASPNTGSGKEDSPDLNEALLKILDRNRFTNEAASHYFVNGRPPLQREPFFFPPDPPPLGAELRLFRPPATGAPAPAEGAAFVNEPFYPILCLRLAAEDLPKRLQLGLDAYRAVKIELQNELRSRIARLKNADPGARQEELTEFARVQTPRIAALEATAAQLRSDLQRGGLYGFFAGRGDWNEYRNWRLGSKSNEKPRPDTLQMEFEVMRAAVCYQDGLSPAQRRLLREIAMELQAEVRQPEAAAQPAANASLIFFLPETARIRLPADLPADLATKIAAFGAEKTALKAELRTTLYTFDDKGNDERTHVLAQLADRQAPRIAALDELAEDIRHGLADVTDMPGPPAPPALPADLEARISTYRGHKLELLKTLHATLASPDSSIRPPAKPNQVQEQVAAFNRENPARFAVLKKEKDGIREALGQYMRALGTARDQKSIDDLLEEFENSRQKQEVWDKYRDYKSAVLMPGLSPEQRRLLYDAAVEELALALPGGEVPR
jgi:hypothetical protein